MVYCESMPHDYRQGMTIKASDVTSGTLLDITAAGNASGKIIDITAGAQANVGGTIDISANSLTTVEF